MGYRSTAYKQVAERVEREYTKPPTHPMTMHWFKRIAPMWRNRVGIPRLTAEASTFEAVGLLRSINRGVFRDPEERERYDRALEALDYFASEFARENWRRFDTAPGFTDRGSGDA